MSAQDWIAILMIVGASALAALWVMVRCIRRILRARQRWLAVTRLNRGYCPLCAYDLAGRAGEACPECGYRFTPEESQWLEAVWPHLRAERQERR